MSLQIWLPLDGVIENYGLDTEYDYVKNAPESITWATGIVTDNAYVAPIGSSEECQAITYQKKYNPTEDISISCWIKFVDSGDNKQGIFVSGQDSNTSGYGIALYMENNDTIVFEAFHDNVKMTVESYMLGTWHHIAATLSVRKGIISIYLDGNLMKSLNYTQGGISESSYTFVGGMTDTTGIFRGAINDLRVYDHELSVMEIQELKKGLRLHYKLTAIESNGKLGDSSGYKYDITLGEKDPIVESNDTARGRYSKYMNINDSVIQSHTVTTSACENNFTVCWWAIQTSACLGKYAFGTTNIRFGSNDDGYGLGTDAGPFVLFVDEQSNPIPTEKFDDGLMHAFAVTGDGTTNKLYVDGEYLGSTKTYVSLTCKNEPIFIGSYNGFSYWQNGMSDFRLYTTVLNDQEIVNLYRSTVFVDDHQNMHTFEFVEPK